MLAKTVNKTGKEWDKHLPYILFAYRTSSQESTTFYLLYRRDARFPTYEIINAVVSHKGATNLDDYISEMSEHMAAAWDCTRGEIKKAQQRQKRQHDKH